MFWVSMRECVRSLNGGEEGRERYGVCLVKGKMGKKEKSEEKKEASRHDLLRKRERARGRKGEGEREGGGGRGMDVE